MKSYSFSISSNLGRSLGFMKHSICIDGGGTKTSFTLYSPEGIELSKSVDQSIHLQQVEIEKAKKIIKNNIYILCNAVNLGIHQVVISAGLAGYGSNEVIRGRFDYVFEKLFPDNEVFLTSDGHIALLGALEGKDGILVIAGTGSIAYRLHQGKLTRTGGWGYLLGDEGSAYSISRQLLSIFTKQADGRLDKTRVYDLVKEVLNLDADFDLVKYINTVISGSRTDIAKISKINYQLALENDPYGIEIFYNAASELALHVKALANEEEEVIVSYVGGVFNARDFVLGPMSKMIGNATIVEPKNSPEYGAYLYYKSQQ